MQFYRDYENEQVERLARRICEAYGADPDRLVKDNGYPDAPMIPEWWKHQDFALQFLACSAALSECP
ncbi:hypothetical protein [Paracoccus denitrificans]|uniref:hypothetical protein n=1 Tax=Paracoccus denitrificans TaxID=266 RepID=UPI00336527D5